MINEHDDILEGGLIDAPAAPPRRRRTPVDYDDIVSRHAARTGLDPNLIHAVIGQESRGNPRAISSKGARGPMQLMPATARRFGVTDPHDPEQAIRAGTSYLKFLNDRYKGNVDLTLAGYNAGEGAVDKYKGIPPYRETQNYVPQVKARMGQAPQRKKPAPDILDGGLISQTDQAAPPLPPEIAEMASLTGQQPEEAPQGAPSPEAQAGADVAQPSPPTAPSLSAYDAAWHFGMNPDEARRLTRRQQRVLSEAVAEDQRKKAAGQTIEKPPLDYQNQMRQRAGLAPLQFNQGTRKMQIGSLSVDVPVTARGASPYYQPDAGQLPSNLTVPKIETRVNRFRFGDDPTAATRRREMVAAETKRREELLNSGVITPEARNTPGFYTPEAVERAVDEQLKRGGDPYVEAARKERVAGMGWGEYLAQAPKSVALAGSDALATSLKAIAVLNKKMDQPFGGYGEKETTDLPAYRLGEWIQQTAREKIGSDPGLEQEFIVGQAPAAIGQAVTFMLGGWASKAPKVATIILGMGMTAGDAYDEVRASGGSDGEAVNAGLIAGGLLGPTELIGLRGAMKALSGSARSATWQAALKEAYREGRRDIVENTLQEIGQEWGQGKITGNERTGSELLTAGALGAVGGTVTTPLTFWQSRPRKDARPIQPAEDVTERAEEGPIQLPDVGPRPVVLEKPSAIAAQMDALTSRRGSRLAVLIPKGDKAPTKIPKGFATTRTSEGVFIHPKELTSAEVQKMAKDGTAWQLLGHQNPDNPEATRIVVARSGRDAAGNILAGDELMASYVEPGQEQNAIDEMRAQFGPYKPYFEVGGNETAAQVVTEREITPNVPRIPPTTVVESPHAKTDVQLEGVQQPSAIPDEAILPGAPQRVRENVAENAPDATIAAPEGYSSQRGERLPEPGQADTTAVRELRQQPGRVEADRGLQQAADREVAMQEVSSRFEGLSNQQLTDYIAKTGATADRRIARLQRPLPKGTRREVRESLPRRIERQRTRTETRIADAQAELERRRQGTDKIPSFEQWLESESGGTAGGTRPETLTTEERNTLLARYDAEYYGRPHHAKFQNRRKRSGRFAPGAVTIPDVAEIADRSDGAKTGNVPIPPALWDAAPEGKLFASAQTATAREPTADEAEAAKVEDLDINPRQKQAVFKTRDEAWEWATTHEGDYRVHHEPRIDRWSVREGPSGGAAKTHIETDKIHAVAITDQMRESLPEGQALFRRKQKAPKPRAKDVDAKIRTMLAERGRALKEAPQAAPAPSQPAATPPPPRRILTAVPKTGEVKERSYPNTLEKHGYRGGTDRDYTVLTNPEALERAERKLVRLGQGRAAAELAQTDDPGAEDTAMGILLMQRFERTGEIQRAVAVATDLSKKLTRAGQFVQAASIVSRLSPEGVLLHAQKILKPGRELSPETARTLVEQAREISEAEKLIAEIQRQRPDIFGPNGQILPRVTAQEQTRDSGRRPTTRKSARAKIGNLQDRLATMEQQARARMEARSASAPPHPGGPEAGAIRNPVAIAADLADLVVIGAAKMARSGITQAVWLAEMAKEAAALKRKDLRRLYRESFEMYEAERKKFLQESRVRGAQRTLAAEGTQGPMRMSDYNRVINDRLDAISRARKARLELSRTFRDINAGRFTRGLRRTRDVWNLSRSLITSLDFSAAGRQGKMGIPAHPRSWVRGFARQFRALSTKQYERIMSEIEADPDYKYAVRFKLHLAGLEGIREEAFESDLVKYIPWIKHSEQAYNTMLNTLRMGWLKTQLAMARRAGLDPDDPNLKEQFIRDTSLINNFTGRGGGRFVEQIAPITNTLAFSTRFWASRLRVLTLPLAPQMYGIGENAYSRPARVDAWKTVFGFYGLVTAQIGLAALAGAQIGLDPEDWENFVFNPDNPDFLKVRFGKVHVDFTAGQQTHLRVAARLAMTFYKREYQKGRARKGPGEILRDYGRSKLAPNPALLYDLFLSEKKDTESGPKGTDFAGQPVYLTGDPKESKVGRLRTSALFQRVAPIVVQDAMDAYKEGLSVPQFTGATVASVLGEGVTTYSKNYNERSERWPMKQELDRLGITINPPKMIKPGKYENFKAETAEEYDTRRRKEAAAIKVELERLEGMNYYKRLSAEDQEREIRAAIQAGRETARPTTPASQRQYEARP